MLLFLVVFFWLFVCLLVRTYPEVGQILKLELEIPQMGLAEKGLG